MHFYKTTSLTGIIVLIGETNQLLLIYYDLLVLTLQVQYVVPKQ